MKASTAATAFGSLVEQQENKSLLRFITCGSVDDGKSTLIGRLLFDAKLIFDDQLATLAVDSRRHGTTGEQIDLALLVDGLEAEREQGITIDVAYRFFDTPRRKFIVADTPGHEQFTRNMATGASTADLAIVLVDARRGVLQQTRRHSFICSLLGIRHIVLAVNKLDLLGYDRSVFDGIVESYRAFAEKMSFASVVPIPISARYGDNVTSRSDTMLWHTGPSLLEHLETVDVDGERYAAPFRFPVQYVTRPNLNFRGLAGTVASGSIARGDALTEAKTGRETRLGRIVTQEGDLERAEEGQAVTLVLDNDIEVSRGSMLSAPESRPHVADQFAANILWFDDHPMMPGRSYLLRTVTDQVNVTVTDLKFRVDVNTLAHEAAKSLGLNEVAECNLYTQAPIAFDTYRENRTTGAFILIDRMSNATAGAGMILHPLRRASNVHWQALAVDRHARAFIKHQKPAVLWFTGLSGSGKSTLANLLEKRLHVDGRHTYILDGDNVRHGLNRDLGFTEEDRVENIRRVAEVAKLMVDAGLLVLVSFISPFRAERRMARELLPAREFVEIFVDAPLETCIQRDPKGLYAKALRGELINFTGLDSPYEAPEAPDVHLRTGTASPEDLVEALERWLQERGYL